MLKQRSELKRKTPLRPAASITKTQKPPKGPKAYKCKNLDCRGPYFKDPKKPWIDWCSVDCGTAIALLKLAKQKATKAKADRAETTRLREEQKPIKYHLKKTEALVNQYVRLRDKNDGCISCHMPSHYDGVWTASHFKSVGSNSALRFNLWNIHKGCEQCNLFKSGNIAEYEKRLILKVGHDRVEWLKNHNRMRKYDVEYLMRLQSIMRRKIKRLEKRNSHDNDCIS